MRRTFSVVLATALAAAVTVVLAAPASGTGSSVVKRTLVEGASLVGGTNGIAFDAANNLYTAQVLGHAISKIDPETGEILGGLGLADSVLFPDDVTVGADGTVYWTDPGVGTVFRQPPGGPTEPLVPFGGLPSANPLALSDDGKRLFAAGCFDGTPNSVVEIDLATLNVRTILANQPGCASNSFDFIVDANGEALYGPRWFEGRVVRIDVASGDITDVTTGWGVPAAAKFDSKGNLYAANQGNGEVVKIDLSATDLTANREVVAQLPVGWIDNIAFDKDDRLYISSASDATVLEILPGGTFRTVSPGGMAIATGIAVLRDTVHAINLGAMPSFNTRTGKDAGVTRSVFGLGPLQAPTTIATWNNRLVMMSALTGSLMVWDPKAGAPRFTTQAGLPVDAQPFEGDLIWTETATGNVVRGSGPELADREILGTFDGPTGLAATDDDLYVGVLGTGEVLQLIANGKLLETPIVVASGLVIPEGLALHRANTRLLVVDGGTQTLEEIYLKSGNRRTIASELGFSPAIPGVGEFGWFNNVEVDRRGHMFVNGDGANVIWKLTRAHKGHRGGKGHHGQRAHQRKAGDKYEARRHRHCK